MSAKRPQVFVDADACPVTGLVIAIAKEYGLEVTLVCDFAHEMQRDGAKTLTVFRGADSADFALVNLLRPGDVLVTQDYGLAAMALARSAQAISQNGLCYTQENIDGLLGQRHEARKLRRAGHHTKGPRRRASVQDEAFAKAFRALLSALTGRADMV